jgi:ribosomal protein S18 acetylase RimI-like enzyme
MSVDVVRWGGDRLRVGPWRGNARMAYIALSIDGPTPSVAGVRHCLDVLADRGYIGAVTAALGPAEAQAFLTVGFEVRERLHLLRHDLTGIAPGPASVALRRAHRSDRPLVLELDHQAFPPFWQLDAAGLDDALAATPTTRFRVTDRGMTGYAITGRAGRRGYLQRLAVDPSVQRQGVGTALALDGLRWVRRRGASEVLVNTQESNTAALSLYERLGFRRQPSGLAVLEASVG